MKTYTSGKICFLLVFLWPVLQIGHAQSSLSVEDKDAWSLSMFEPKTRPQFVYTFPEIDDAYGVAFRDINDDFLPDLYVVRFRNLNRLFINRGNNRGFRDRTIRTGLGGNLTPRREENLELGAAAVDVDNDGWVDIMITGWTSTTRLYHQERGFEFDNWTGRLALPDSIDANGAAWADIDGNGLLDVYLTDEHFPNHLFLQMEPGQFVNRSREMNVADSAISQSTAFSDVDGDGDPDLYVCNWFAPDRFYRNEDGRRFTRMTLDIPHLTDTLNSNGVTLADIDNDGDPDLLVTDRSGYTGLYRNNTDSKSDKWSFIEITVAMNLDNPYPAYGGLIADFNNDGWQDIFFTNIGPNILYLNDHGDRFIQAYREAAPEGISRQYSTGSAVADLQGDNDLDLFVANKDTISQLLINPLDRPNSAIRLTLEGVESNREAIGAKVWLYRNDDTTITGYREVVSASAYLSQSEPVVHLGTPQPGPYRAVIQFPSGKRITIDHLNPGDRKHISEMTGVVKTMIRARQWVGSRIYEREFWTDLLLFVLILIMLAGFSRLAMIRYRWSGVQITWYYGWSLFVIGIVYGIMANNRFPNVLEVEAGVVALGIVILTIVQEQLHSLKMKRYGYRRILQSFSEQVILIHANEMLYKRLTDVAVEAVGVEYSWVCVAAESDPGNWRMESVSGTHSVPESVELSEKIQEKLQRQPGGILSRAEALLPEKLTRNVAAIVLIKREMNLLALWGLGPLPRHRSLTDDDISIFAIVAREAALAIENNRYIVETRELTAEVTEARTREKYIAELEEKNNELQRLYQELQATQAQLIQSEKMSSLGQLVAGIAHELNNPISYIYANMATLKELTEKQLKDRTPLTTEDRKDLEAIIEESAEGSRRVKTLVDDLRNFSRLDEAEFKPADIHEGLNSTLKLLRKETADRITVHRKYGDVPAIQCMPGQLNQVFMNILLNAVQAIEGHGDIRIRTESDDNYVNIRIQDNGSGMTDENKQQMFNPFYTTKPVGQGTGLGLSISFSIIRAHRGELLVDSTPGKGTTMTIRLPIAGPDTKRDSEASSHDE